MSAAPLRQSYAQSGAAPAPSAAAYSAPGTRSGAAPAPGGAPRRREHLHAVSAPQQSRSLVPFAALCVAIVLGALASVLLLNTTMARGAYDAQELRIEIAAAHQQRATLLTQLEAASAPGGLAQSAQQLGMVPAENMGFVSIAMASVLDSSG